jgi:hypothetical protein
VERTDYTSFYDVAGVQEGVAVGAEVIDGVYFFAIPEHADAVPTFILAAEGEGQSAVEFQVVESADVIGIREVARSGVGALSGGVGIPLRC